MKKLIIALVLIWALVVGAAVTVGVVLLSDDDDPANDGTSQPTEDETSDEPSEPTGRSLDEFYEQEIEWTSCGSYECGTLEVPVDYAEPGGATIELNLSRVPATGDNRVGSLVVNPGGPGGAGSDMVESQGAVDFYFEPELQQAFDIVGFDPRGTGESAPIDCLSDGELDDYLAADQTPDDPGEVDEFAERQETFWDGCLDGTGDRLAHVTTVESATDMDVLREALGDDQLNYLGFSYGTKLGATYAELFPDKAGRLVLDAAVDPELDFLEGSLSQAEGFEVALRSYVRSCVEKSSTPCFLGDTVEEGLRTISDLVERIDDKPLPTDLGRDLEVGNAYAGIFMPLYARDRWSFLDQGLQQALNGDGTTLLALSDAYADRQGGGYASNIMEAFPAISCLDSPDSVPLDEVEGHLADFKEVAPTLGDNWAWGLYWCADIPVEKTVETPKIRAKGAAPIIVIGTTRDPATPYEEAVALADQLESGVLVTRDGDGHGGYGKSPCVNDAVHRLLIEGKAPDGDVTC